MKTININGITCMNCVASVTKALQTLDSAITVSLTPPQALVPDHINAQMVKQALAPHPKYTVLEEVEIKKSWFQTYLPLIIIMGLISLVSLKEAYDFHGWMMSFMAGFFIVFGGFKLFDLNGFADTYATYDILAARSRLYALAYPFIEIALGFAFLFHYQMRLTTWISLALVTFGTIGVVQALNKKQTIQCACLGSVFNLPMTSVTLIENGMMIAMCVWMLI